MRSLAEIERRVLGLQVAPALERAARLRRGRDQRLLQQDLATTLRALAHRLDRCDALADQDHALEHPVERAAVQQLAGALRRLAGVDDRPVSGRGARLAPGAQVL